MFKETLIESSMQDALEGPFNSGENMFKDYLQESTIYTDPDTGRWGIEPEILKVGSKFGKLKAVFQLKMNQRDNKAIERWFFEIPKSEASKYKATGSEIVGRFVTLKTASSGMALICKINTDNGKVHFLKNYEDDDTEFEARALKTAYIRLANTSR